MTAPRTSASRHPLLTSIVRTASARPNPGVRMPRPRVQSFFDDQTSTYSHVLHQEGDRACAVIDAVLNYDPKSGRTATDSADEIIEFVQREGLAVQWILETHAHADHLSAAAHLKARLP